MRIHTYSSVTTSCVVCFYTIFFICLLVWLFVIYFFFFFFSSRRRHTRLTCDWSSDVCSSDLGGRAVPAHRAVQPLAAGPRSAFVHLRAARATADLRAERHRAGSAAGPLVTSNSSMRCSPRAA